MAANGYRRSGVSSQHYATKETEFFTSPLQRLQIFVKTRFLSRFIEQIRSRGEKRGRRVRLLILALLVLAWQGSALPLSADAKWWLEPALALAAPACVGNPFGSSYDLFGEGEIFVGYTSSGIAQNRLANISLDVQPSPVDPMLLEQNFFLEGSQPWGRSIREQTAVAADLDGDGQTEMVQSFVSGDAARPGYYVAVFDSLYAVAYSQLSDSGYSHLAAAAGNILGADDQREQVVLAAVDDGAGALTLAVWDGAVNNGTLIPLATLLSTAGVRAHASSLDVAVGNINGDLQDDIIVTLLDEKRETIEVILLTYDPAYSSGGDANNWADKLRVLAADTFNAGTFRDVQVAPVRIDGDFRDEIVVAADTYDPDAPDISPQIRLFLYGYDPVMETFSRLPALDATIQARITNFALATGDVDGKLEDGIGVSPEEIVVGFGSVGGEDYPAGFGVDVWRAEKMDTPDPVLARYEQWITNNTERSQAGDLSLAVADLDNDGQQEIVAALDDGRGLEVLYLTLGDLMADAPDLPAGQRVNLTPTDLTGKTAVAVGDRDNDAIKAIYSAECKEVTEQRVTAVGFAPPYWGQLQGDVFKGVAIGRTLAAETAETTALTYYRSDTVSGYFGGSVGGNIGIASLQVSAKVSAAETKTRSSASGETTGFGESLSVQRTGNDDFVIFENTRYNCYAYALSQNGVTIPDAFLRNCDYVSSSRLTTNLDAWDNTWGLQADGVNQTLTWTPVARDWASLGLFRGDFAVQSSTLDNQRADRAVDGVLFSSPANDSVATTARQDNPWWQIDLGRVQPISKVRLWNRTDWLSCTDLNACPNQLDHIYVLISATDFRTMAEEGDPAALMARPDVYAFSLADFADSLPDVTAADPLGQVTTFLTLDGSAPPQPVQGRFVRVQRALPDAQLSLGEVQIFGTNQVNPDRYPVNVREKGSETDGVFEVQMYNPLGTTPETTWPWVEVRGNLLWNRTGYADGALQGELVSLGNAGVNWTYSSYNQGGSFATRSLTHETSIGAEFDYSAGAIFQMQVGYGRSFTTGTTAEYTVKTSWTDALEFGGRVNGFPSGYEGQPWVLACAYEMRPYYYELIETSTFGMETRYPVLDYIVPDVSVTDALGNNSAGLKRLDAQAMANCANGNRTGATVQANDDQATTTAGDAVTIRALTNDVGAQLRIVDVSQPQHGQVTFSERSITYTPDPGFIGQDAFTYTVSDGVATSQGTITVGVGVAPVPKRAVFLPLVTR